MICLIVGEPAPGARARLGKAGDLAAYVPFATATREQLKRAEVLLVWDFHWTGLSAALPRMASLRWIHTASAGVDHLSGLRGRAVALTNSAGVFDRPIAEYVIGLILAHAKGLAGTILAQADRRWAYRETSSVAGATVVIVGFGRIGQTVADLAQSIGMAVIGIRRSSSGGAGRHRIAAVDQMLNVLPSADYVVVCAALTPQTRGLLGPAALRAMKASAYLINVARAPIVDTAALYECLRTGSIAGAALDVHETEPLPEDDEAWSVPNLLVSPHMAGDDRGWDIRVADRFLANLERYERGLPLEHAVDLARGY